MKYTFATCAGRHDTPAKEAIFPQNVENIFDFGTLYITADKKIPADCGWIELYVTGLTPCVLAVAAVCHDRDIALTCYHYDKDTGEYRGQVLY